jgi:hypothetical protein
MTSLLGDIESHGGSVVFASRFLSARALRSAFTVIVESSGDADEVSCNWLVNNYPSQLFNARMLRICQSQIRLF